MTLAILIGNSDDKLTQKNWVRYVQDVGICVARFSMTIHHHGHSNTVSIWQNACWVFEFDAPGAKVDDMKELLRKIAKRFKQDSIALVEGKTEFLKGVEA